MASFGYLNQNNPLTIADHEAQEMINCSIERGWIEYKDYPVPEDKYISVDDVTLCYAVPNRTVTLPNGDIAFIKGSGSHYHRQPGRVYLKKNSVYTYLGVEQPTVTNNTTVTSNSSIIEATGTATTVANKYNYEVQLSYPTGGGIRTNIRVEPFANSDNRLVFKNIQITNNGITESKSLADGYSWFNNGNGNICIITPTGVPTGATLTISFDYSPTELISDEMEESIKVFYALTVVETSTTSPLYGYESAPYLFEAYANPFYNQININLTVNIQDCISPKINIYRIPYGGDEYLSLLQFNASTGNNTILQVDNISDKNLGSNSTETFPSTLETNGNSNNYGFYQNIEAIILHTNCLFLASDKYVYYSKSNSFAEFPAENFFAFPDKVVGFCPIYSELAILTEKEIYILYGENTNGFILSRINYHSKENILNSAQSAYGKILSLSSYNTNYKFTWRDEILLTNTRFSYNIGLRVKDLLKWTHGVNVANSDDFINRNTVLENRYYVVELVRNETQDNSNVRLTKNLVYDVLSDGFCVYDESINDSVNHKNYFKYRTKEFQIKGMFTQGAQYHKSMWVRGKGNFKVKFYGDNVALSNDESGYIYDNTKNVRTGEANTDVDIIKTYYFNVRPDRYVTFSIEFIGEEGAEIHDWGIL